MNRNLTKSVIIQHLAQRFNLPSRQAKLIVDSIFNNIICSTLMNEKVVLRGFGSFYLKVAKSRLSRNPQTGAEIHVKTRRSLCFKAGQSLYDRLNKG